VQAPPKKGGSTLRKDLIQLAARLLAVFTQTFAISINPSLSVGADTEASTRTDDLRVHEDHTLKVTRVASPR